jgi:hypothetical protein
MIDTLQQRLLGRKEQIEALLVPWLARHFVIYAGFSAEDLNHDPNYLGLCRAAADSPGAMFIRYPGSDLQPGARSLLAAYGDRGFEVTAFLDAVFGPLLERLQIPLPEPPEIVDADPRGTVARKVEEWAGRLQPYEAINVLAALFDSSGEEDAAWRLLHKTWKSRLSNDSVGPHYARYQFNYARHCLTSGETKYEETPENFYRSRHALPQAVVGAATFWFYCGQPQRAEPFAMEAEQLAAQAPDPRLVGDLALFRATEAVVRREGERFAEILAAGNRQREWGDLPRAARLWSAAARLAALAGNWSDAIGLFDHTKPVSDFIGDQTIAAELFLAQGIAMLHRGSTPSARTNLAQAIPIVRTLQRWPLLIEALIEGVRCALADGSDEEARALFSEAKQRIVGRYDVYLPLLKLAEAEHHVQRNQPEYLVRAIEDGLPAAVATGNRFAEDRFRALLASAKVEADPANADNDVARPWRTR